MTSDGVRVLVVDDEVIRHLVRVNLELEGFEIYTAVAGSTACGRWVRCGRP